MARLVLVLHAHLPWVVGHGVWPHGEEWLSEAAADSYLPLLLSLERLATEGRRGILTLSFSPVLCEQLAHPGWQRRFRAYLETRIRTAEADQSEFERAGERGPAGTAHHWGREFRRRLRRLDELDGRLLPGFKALADRGVVQLIASAATHGYLPLMLPGPCVRAQVALARASHTRHFGAPPEGLWLPECGIRTRGLWPHPLRPAPMFREGTEETLAAEGLGFFFADTHMLGGRSPRALYSRRFDAGGRASPMAGEFLEPAPGGELPTSSRRGGPAPDAHRVYLAGVDGRPPEQAHTAFFTRDERLALQVWSSEHGYPGDPRYLEFHKRHHPGGLRYWRVTARESGLGEKQVYDAAAAAAAASQHARHFADLARAVVAADRRAVVCVPFDAELFGHWWHEGPRWLEAVLRVLHPGEAPAPATCREALLEGAPAEAVYLREGSWGDGGDHRVWWNQETEPTWARVHEAEERFMELAPSLVLGGDRGAREAATDAARQLLLLEASDWPFLIRTGQARDYAEARVRGHAADFDRALRAAGARLRGRRPDPAEAGALEAASRRDSLFPEIDLAWWCPVGRAARHTVFSP